MRTMRWATSFLLLGSWAALATAAETVRVEVRSGVPQLVVDGKPVRARFFYGDVGTQLFPVGTEGRLVSFEFSPKLPTPTPTTMHLRFSHVPGKTVLDDLRVTDLETGSDILPPVGFEEAEEDIARRWSWHFSEAEKPVATLRVSPRGGRDGSAGLEVTLQEPADRQWPRFSLKYHSPVTLTPGHRYRVTFWARTETKQAMTVTFFAPTQTPVDGPGPSAPWPPGGFLGPSQVQVGGPDEAFASQIRLAAAAGVDLVTFGVSLPWPRPGEAVDWSGVDQACQRVLEANPQALLVPRIFVYAPQWWFEVHPEAKMVWDQPVAAVDTDVTSPEFLHDAGARVAALVEHLEAKFGPHLAGYHPCGQETAEWFYRESWGPALNGYSPPTAPAFRTWLAKHYATDAALQAAWQDPQVTRATASVPTSAARRATPGGTLRDPLTERAVIDFNTFQQEAMADCVAHFAHVVRQASGGRHLVFFFYGYQFEFGPMQTGPASCGHYALRRLLECPDIDVFCSPTSYGDRQLGGSAPLMSPAESVALAGKLWLTEDDTRTCLTEPDAVPGRLDTVEETRAVLRRNTAQCALRNFGTWWMDLGATGWFDHPDFWNEMRQLALLDEALLEHPRPFQPEIAAVIDERSVVHTSFNGREATGPCVAGVRRLLGRIGAPYGQYLLDDVTAGRVSAKLYVMLTAWYLAPEQRRELLKATTGSLRIWCYAPGYLEPSGTSLEAMRELTGFSLRPVTPATSQAEPTAVGQALGLGQSFGKPRSVAPLFAATDATAEETLATYADGSAAVALRKTSEGYSLFVGPPGLTSELLRLAARKAGVHLYTQTDCNVYANGPYLAVHAAQDGPLEIDTGRAAPIRDLMTGAVLGQGPKLSLPVRLGETRVLQVE